MLISPRITREWSGEEEKEEEEENVGQKNEWRLRHLSPKTKQKRQQQQHYLIFYATTSNTNIHTCFEGISYVFVFDEIKKIRKWKIFFECEL
jgi:hypothetical protein